MLVRVEKRWTIVGLQAKLMGSYNTWIDIQLGALLSQLYFCFPQVLYFSLCSSVNLCAHLLQESRLIAGVVDKHEYDETDVKV